MFFKNVLLLKNWKFVLDIHKGIENLKMFFGFLGLLLVI